MWLILLCLVSIVCSLLWVVLRFLYGKEHSRCIIYLSNGLVVKTNWKPVNKDELQSIFSGDTNIIDDGKLITIVSPEQQEKSLIKIQFKRRLF